MWCTGRCALRRKILAISCDVEEKNRLMHIPLHEMQRELKTMLEAYTKKKHVEAMNKWKASVKRWSLSTKHVFSFVRNLQPMKMPVVHTPSGATNQPYAVDKALREYWGAFETWPEYMSTEIALGILEDKYGMLLPRYPWHWNLTGRDLLLAAKYAGESACGVDAWTITELKKLPEQAWQSLLHVIKSNPCSLLESLVLVVRRVPLQKDPKKECEPSNVRPIDTYSTIMRVFSRAVCNVSIQWKANVFHPAQRAIQGGIGVAVAKIAYRTEVALLNLLPPFSVSVDFSKMFNNLSPVVGAQTAKFMGLSDELAHLMALPLCHLTQAWRLPFNGNPTLTKPQRGLPQGMSGSVLLAECTISPLIWRLHHSLSEPQHRTSLMVGYVDDLYFMMGNEAALRRTLEILCEFERDFGLTIAAQKTHVWTTDPRATTRAVSCAFLRFSVVFCENQRFFPAKPRHLRMAFSSTRCCLDNTFPV